MRKIATLGVAAVFAVLSFAAVTAPAQAGGISFGFGGYDDDFGYDWDDDYGGGVYVEIDPDDYIVEDDSDYDGDDRHTAWCESHYQTYDEDTDMYFYAAGKQKRCISPWS